MKLPIESFEKYRYQCKECRRKYKKEKYKTDIINQGNSKNAFVQSIPQSVDNLNQTTNVHVHRPPAVTLNETPKEFHISLGLCQKI
jgi:hypothetical protein